MTLARGLTSQPAVPVSYDMRCVAAPLGGGPPPPQPAELDAVRYLCRRFPEARVREVPIVRAHELDARADPSGATRVWLALEQLQVTGSFKVRGALVALARAMDRGRVVTSS